MLYSISISSHFSPVSYVIRQLTPLVTPCQAAHAIDQFYRRLDSALIIAQIFISVATRVPFEKSALVYRRYDKYNLNKK